MKKILLTAVFLFFLIRFVSSADYETTNYKLIVPEEGSRDWSVKISNDIISIDNIMKAMSNDLGTTSTKIIVSRDAVTTVGDAVGRIKLISADGSACYIPVYAPN